MNGSSITTTDPVQALLAQTSLQNTLFSANSRYFGIGTASLTDVKGRTIVYLLRRWLPNASSFQLLQVYSVMQNDRLDNIAAKYLGDPTLFWRLCDANNAMCPDDLTETVGRKLAITLPQGITGSSL